MRSFENFRGEKINLSNGTQDHINDFHPEIKTIHISKTLKDPDEVRTSSKKNNSELYYLLKIKNRYFCVVVKRCPDGNFISTALTTSKPKAGIVLYKKGEK